MILKEGDPVRTFVAKEDYQYYAFRATEPDTDVTFVVTSFGGDPDLYIGCDLSMTHDDEGLPSRTNYVNKSQLDGTDIFTTNHSLSTACNHNGPATFYAAIYGYNRVSYSIMALQKNTSVTLVDGQAQTGYVREDETQLYEFHLDATHKRESIEITLSGDFGDPDLYITTDGSEPSKKNNTTCSFKSEAQEGTFLFVYIYVYIYIYSNKNSN